MRKGKFADRKVKKNDFRQSLSVALIKGYFWETVLPPWLVWGRHNRASTAHRTKSSTLMLPVCSAVSSSSSPFTALPAFRDPEVCAGYSHAGGGPTRPERDTLYSPKYSENPPPTPYLKTHPVHPKISPATARRRNYLTFSSLFNPIYLFLSFCLSVCQVRFVQKEESS